ncbi:DNA-binding response regulator, partial [Streptococcus anginosus]|nr:DNA-binding response regulator [Streptococcus anginosus]
VTKPYSYRELVARVRAVLRRASTGAADDVDEDVLRVGRVEMDTDKHEVYVGGELISMPLREFELLELFLRNPDRVLTRPQILDRI